jgi:hypothetical protein
MAENLFERGLCLPSGTAMIEEDMDRVVEVIIVCGAGHRAQGAGRKKDRGERKEERVLRNKSVFSS